ncbi:MAG: spermidine/putrescine transporter substrate-binding protein PotF, partial [Rhodospirillales bacterium]|nr:spermidine/putrescine transporter substrate-binding protein PotF [Rhodospirillales bacterium]
ASITTHVRYPNAVPASRALVAEAVRNDPSVYPTDATLAGSFVAATPSQATERLRTRMWSRFKAGR